MKGTQMKTTIFAVTVAVLLSACGPDKFTQQCTSADDQNLIGLMGVDSDNKAECSRLIFNVTLAKHALMREYTNEDGSKYQAIKSEQEWTDKFFGVTLIVKNTTKLQNPYDPIFSDDTVSGNYDSTKVEIQVDATENAIAHELFHRIDDRSGDAGKWVGSFTHAGWDHNGYQHGISDYEGSFSTIPGTHLDPSGGYY